jgi:RNA polymerase-binding transcription factor DksA
MPLTHEQALELVCVIEERRAALLDELRKDLGRARADNMEQLAGPAPDPGDESVARTIADLDQAEVTRDVGELRQLEEARRRFDEGNYGTCIDCGTEIDYRRLRVNPAATRCIRCQERLERTRGLSGRPTL